ncbi:unnamed protein product [Dovyalis caffra]|uniref:Uncharacterized protein n=1 Tax=Dovyalis caffra TaxID=77055 RepID=A0AAV1QND7_9ROSI|nr:unnamed protein product [Dovyalis caffra]CAK7328766.1 unnamed protein product [Dovyalis caffra]
MLGLAGSSSESEKKTETEQIVSVTYLIYEDLFPLFEVTPTSYESVTWNHAKRLESRKARRTTEPRPPELKKDRPKGLAVSRHFVYVPSLRSFGEEGGGYYYA